MSLCSISRRSSSSVFYNVSTKLCLYALSLGAAPPPSFTMSQQSYVSDALSLGAVPPPSFTMSQQSYVSDALSLGAAPLPSFAMSQQSYVSMLYL